MPQPKTTDTELSRIRMAVLKWIAGQSDQCINLSGLVNIKQHTIHINQRRTGYEYKGPNLPNSQQLSVEQICEAVFMLIAQGFAYITFGFMNDFREPYQWLVRLSELGQRVAEDDGLNPYDHNEYLCRITDRIPQINDTVLQYIQEALGSFQSRCYLASAVMLGVASEAAFLEMAQSFGIWLTTNGQGQEGQSFLQTINGQKSNYITKFDTFRKKIEPHKSKLPNELSDGMALTFDAVLDLLRIYRNDSGHPTGKQIDLDTAFINLQMFARYLEKLYQFKTFFESEKQEG